MKKENITKILSALDQEYGIGKDGFHHHKDWQLLIAIMLSAQSTDKQVEDVLPGLWKKYPAIEELAEAPIEEIEETIRTVGLYKSKAKNMTLCCNQILSEYQGVVPKELDQLVQLAGVGRKTATLFLADMYGIPGVTVDTHVLRISQRLGWAKGKNPVQVEKELMKVLPEDHWIRINYQLIYLGRSICTARTSHCDRCILEEWCEKKNLNKKKSDKTKLDKKETNKKSVNQKNVTSKKSVDKKERKVDAKNAKNNKIL